MYEEEKSPLFVCYFKDHAWRYIFWAGMIFLVLFVYSLYNLPMAPAFYAGLLLLFIGALLELFGYGRYRKKIWSLRLVQKQEGSHLELLPAPGSNIEAAYTEIIKAADAKSRREIAKFEDEQRKAALYYTLWSHQIKTPISGMRLLLAEEAPDKQAMETELFKIEQYVEMVLQYQRLGSVSNDLVIRSFTVEYLVKQAVKKTAVLFLNKPVAVELGSMPDEIVTDEKWMVFVLEQVISNAVKYTRRGKIAVYMDKKLPMTLVIEDTGIGIRKEDLPRVFEWGYTGYNGRMDKRATGIGLALCRQTLQMLGCSIALESEPGKGTKALITLKKYNPAYDI